MREKKLFIRCLKENSETSTSQEKEMKSPKRVFNFYMFNSFLLFDMSWKEKVNWNKVYNFNIIESLTFCVLFYLFSLTPASPRKIRIDISRKSNFKDNKSTFGNLIKRDTFSW